MNESKLDSISESSRNDTVIETDCLTKRFGTTLALREFTLKVSRGGFHAVVGSNGAGKSTLFRILLGLLSPSQGECRILGVDSHNLGPSTRQRIGLVTEEHALPEWMTVENLRQMQSRLHPRWQNRTYQKVADNFHFRPKQRVSELSRGERAGFAMAIALAQGPELLILDEPTLGLDVVSKQSLLESLLFAGEQENTTVIYCSHQMDEVERLADQLIVIEEGELVSQSSPELFWRRISCWIVDGPLPQFVDVDAIPGLLQRRLVEGREHLVVLDQSLEFGRCLEGLGIPKPAFHSLGFDQAVNAFLSRNHRGTDQNLDRLSA